MAKAVKPQKLYRIRFQCKDDSKSVELVATTITSSDFLGLLRIDGFVFNDNKKQVILPGEDEARKRFGKIACLHIPYHSVITIEEFWEKAPDLKNLPFMKELEKHPE